MALKNLFKLEKLTIEAYNTSKRKKLRSTFKAMFNPASVSIRHDTVFAKPAAVGASSQSKRFLYNPPKEIKLDLIIDGSGVADMGITTVRGKGADAVTEQIDLFIKTCFRMAGDIHQPYFLKITWGDVFRMSAQEPSFECRLKAVDINYTSFDRDGKPLRAELKTEFVEDTELKKRLRKEAKSSPDLTHARIVKNGDTLPLLCKEIYGSSQYYLQVAAINKLENFRSLTPGQQLIFPPLDTTSPS